VKKQNVATSRKTGLRVIGMGTHRTAKPDGNDIIASQAVKMHCPKKGSKSDCRLKDETRWNRDVRERGETKSTRSKTLQREGRNGCFPATQGKEFRKKSLVTSNVGTGISQAKYFGRHKNDREF